MSYSKPLNLKAFHKGLNASKSLESMMMPTLIQGNPLIQESENLLKTELSQLYQELQLSQLLKIWMETIDLNRSNRLEEKIQKFLRTVERLHTKS